MRSRIVAVLLFSGIVFQASSAQTIDTNHNLSLFDGVYLASDGSSFEVISAKNNLRIIYSGNLFDFSDSKVDERYVRAEQKSLDTIRALIRDDREVLSKLFGAAPGSMDDYIESTSEIIAAEVDLTDQSLKLQILGSVYRDEDSAFGFEDNGWGIQSFILATWDSGESSIRFVWDGITGDLMHRGTGGFPPSISELEFSIRPPSRSWIRMFDPEDGLSKRIREVDGSRRSSLIPARFVAYDLASNQSVSVRFRRESIDGPMRLEIGPLGSDLFRSASRSIP